MWAARARTWRTGSPHGSRLGYFPWLILCGLFWLNPGAWGDAPTILKTTKRSYHCLSILKYHHHNNEYNFDNNNSNNNVKNAVLLHINKKDLFLLPSPTEVAFNTTNSPRFHSSAIHLSAIILVFWGLQGVVSYSITE